MKLEISKGKIIKGESVEITFKRTDDNGKVSTGVEEFKDAPHPDLLQAYANCAIHLACMAGYVLTSRVANIENPDRILYEAFNVTSVSTSGEDDTRGVILTGSYKMHSGKVQNFNTPLYRFEEDEKTRYKFMEDLEKRLNRIDIELKAYVDGSKRGATAQQQIEFPETPAKSTKLQILPPVEKKPFVGDDLEDKQQGRLRSIPPADPEAMKRVANGIPEAEINPTKTKGKRVAQSADAPGGIIPE